MCHHYCLRTGEFFLTVLQLQGCASPHIVYHEIIHSTIDMGCILAIFNYACVETKPTFRLRCGWMALNLKMFLGPHVSEYAPGTPVRPICSCVCSCYTGFPTLRFLAPCEFALGDSELRGIDRRHGARSRAQPGRALECLREGR